MLDRNELILNYVNDELESVPSTINSKLTNHGVKLNSRLELNEIKKAFSINGIDFMPLKGAVLQKLYPRIEYRNMTDIDILVRKKDVDKAVKVLKELAYKYDSFSGNHYVFEKAPYMHLELHIDLIHKSYDTSTYYNDIWDSVRIHNDNNNNEYVFTDNDFYIYHIIHMI